MKKVLIVDDTKNIRNLLTTCLELNGYTVSSAKNGMEALELISQEFFDIAFIDIKMPELSGTEVLRRIRAKGISIPVVIMTAFATVKNAVECTQLGAVAYLQKPFTADKVTDLLLALDAKTDCKTVSDLMDLSKNLINEKLYDEALKQLNFCLSIDSSIGEIYYLIGYVHQMELDLIEAEKYYTTAKVFGYTFDTKVSAKVEKS
jgi:two-component system, OmpR family, response regulator